MFTDISSVFVEAGGWRALDTPRREFSILCINSVGFPGIQEYLATKYLATFNLHL
jgi:hypothetical protein